MLLMYQKLSQLCGVYMSDKKHFTLAEYEAGVQSKPAADADALKKLNETFKKFYQNQAEEMAKQQAIFGRAKSFAVPADPWSPYTIPTGYYQGQDQLGESAKEEKVEEKKECSPYNHEWKEYVGFTEVYRYCVRCDKKDKGE
jgi:hypothetical protein